MLLNLFSIISFYAILQYHFDILFGVTEVYMRQHQDKLASMLYEGETNSDLEPQDVISTELTSSTIWTSNNNKRTTTTYYVNIPSNQTLSFPHYCILNASQSNVRIRHCFVAWDFTQYVVVVLLLLFEVHIVLEVSSVDITS